MPAPSGEHNREHIEADNPTCAMPKHFAHAVFDEAAGKLIEYRHLLQHPDNATREQWQRAGSNEFGRLMNGVGRDRATSDFVPGTNSMRFVHRHQIPREKGITYARFVAAIRLQKEEQHRVRLTAGGNRLDYEGKKSTESATLETIKIILNSILSTDHARFVVADIGNMYLSTKLPSPEYMQIHTKLIPDNIMKEYNVLAFTDPNGYAYVEIIGAIYGLSQSGFLAHQDLIQNLRPFGYFPFSRVPYLWHHETRPTKFTLVVDDFGIKSTSKADTQHPIDAIASTYPVKVDW